VVELETVEYREADGVAVVTLNRPEVYNAFNQAMQDELRSVWRHLRENDDVRAVVLTAAGDRAFCTGIDRDDVPYEEGDYFFTPYTYEDPGLFIGPRSQELWKPIVAAVNGIACGGGFYLLGESDILIASDNATFFDPHVTYAMPAVFEPNLMLDKMPFGEAMRMTLMGAHERIGAARALEIGLVSEVVTQEELRDRAVEIATIIASQPAPAVQASLRTLWAARQIGADRMKSLGNVFLNLSMSAEVLREGQDTFTNAPRVKPRTR
jgi:enoyl-CoA hydratase/carnithine racemase